MPQSLSQIWIHIIYSTKNRHPFLEDEKIRKEMHAYLAQVCTNQQAPAAIVGGVEDHVHVLCNLSKNICVKDLVGELKRDSSKWIKKKGNGLKNFYWQAGYGAFSVSSSKLPAVMNYIRNQEKHHKKVSFQEEFLKFLNKFPITWHIFLL